MNRLQLSFFGTFEARLGDKTLTNFRSAKVQGLLIYLVMKYDQSHPRDSLATMFWHDDGDINAKKNLRQSLYRLRGVLGDDDDATKPFLLVTRYTVQFNPTSDFSLDVSDFLAYLESDQLEAGINLYKGELLPGFTCNSYPFEQWLASERRHYHQLVMNVLFELTDNRLAQGDYTTAQALARRQLALETWREEAHYQLMQSLALFGDRSAALAQYETCRRILREELSIEPTAKTQRLAAQIRDQQLQQDAPSSNIQMQRPLITPFVGRHLEHEILVNAYRQASSNNPQLGVLVGNSGIGKTRLAHQFLMWVATQGADVLESRSIQTSAGLSYQPITHLLRERIERENAPEDLLSDLWLSQLTRILPELRDRYPDLPEPTQEESTARQHLFESVARLGQALANRKPLVLFIDDWHWADSASLDLLLYAMQRWAEEHLPILLLLTIRQEVLTESPILGDWLNQLKRIVTVEQCHLVELSQAETEQLVNGLIASKQDASLARFTQWLFSATDGQPLFLTETLKALVAEELVSTNSSEGLWQINWSTFDEKQITSRVLTEVREIVQSWLDRISIPATNLLTAASILAEEATFHHLTIVARLEENDAMTALDELLSRQLLTEEVGHDPNYRFSHQKVREVVYAEASAIRRRILHRRAFEMLESADAVAAELAHHALHAELVNETIRYSLMAGNDAMAVFAVRVAITHYETALQTAEQHGWSNAISGADRQALYTGLGRAYELTEAWKSAQEIYETMIDIAQSLNASAMECLGLNRLATVYINGLHNQFQAIALLDRARLVAKASDDQLGLAETGLNRSRLAVFSGDLDNAHYHAQAALNIARKLKHPQLLARSLSTFAMISMQQRQWEATNNYASEAQQIYISNGSTVLAADSQRIVSESNLFCGHPQKSLALLLEMIDFYEQIDNLWGKAECARMMAQTQLELGDYGDAYDWAIQGDTLARQMHLQMAMVDIAMATLGTVQRTIMALDAARETLSEILKQSADRELIGFVMDWVLSELCAVHALSNDWDGAYNFASQRLQARGDKVLLSMGLSGWYEIEALLHSGHGALARSEVEQFSEVVGDNKRYCLILLRSQAVLAQWEDEREQAITYLDEALLLAQEMSLPGEEWQILGALGRLYLDQGEQASSQQAYAAAAKIILRLAETIDDGELHRDFLSAPPVQSILAKVGKSHF